MATTRRYTLDMGEKFDSLLNELAVEKETTKSEVIRRAVASYAFLNKQLTNGNKVSITDDSDRVVKDVVLP